LGEDREVSFAAGEAITAAGDFCRELLLLIEGQAQVEHRSGDQLHFRALRAGQVLDELEVLTHSNSENTIVAEPAGTRVLAVPVDCFDATLERDPDFARRVLAHETRQLQRCYPRSAGLTAGLEQPAGWISQRPQHPSLRPSSGPCCRLLVHAESEQARGFYEHLIPEFERSPTDPLHMVLLLKDIRRTLHRCAQPNSRGPAVACDRAEPLTPEALRQLRRLPAC
jgi:CRP-like cAMP-binding protein